MDSTQQKRDLAYLPIADYGIIGNLHIHEGEQLTFVMEAVNDIEAASQPVTYFQDELLQKTMRF
jgi:hypothetical protein